MLGSRRETLAKRHYCPSLAVSLTSAGRAPGVGRSVETSTRAAIIAGDAGIVVALRVRHDPAPRATYGGKTPHEGRGATRDHGSMVGRCRGQACFDGASVALAPRWALLTTDECGGLLCGQPGAFARARAASSCAFTFERLSIAVDCICFSRPLMLSSIGRGVLEGVTTGICGGGLTEVCAACVSPSAQPWAAATRTAPAPTKHDDSVANVRTLITSLGMGTARVTST